MSVWDWENDPDKWSRLASLAELGLLTASLVHEIRQPLFTIKARAQLAAAGQGDAVEALAAIERGVEQIEELLSHYGGATDVAAQPRVLDCNVAISTAVQMLDYRANQMGVTLHVDLCEHPLWAQVRDGAMRQVVVNLIQNALDAAEGQERREVFVTSQVRDQWVEIVVADSGDGVATDMVGRMFEPFVTSKPAGKGTGLGLFVARNLVEQAGGRLAIVDGQKGGAEATVVLPRVSNP